MKKTILIIVLILVFSIISINVCAHSIQEDDCEPNVPDTTTDNEPDESNNTDPTTDHDPNESHNNIYR